MRARPRAGGSQVAFVVLLAAFGFLVAATALQERLREQEIPSRRQELQELVRARRADVRALSAEVTRLSEDLSRFEEEVARGSAEVREVVEEADRLRTLAGQEALQGRGVVVELSDSDRVPTTREEASDLRIQDVDLQLVANALWRAGAEALAVNGRRIVATTAIRSAGGTILVNYRAVTSPYRLVAIGDPNAILSALGSSMIGERFSVWKDVYGLGFSAEQVDRASVPALTGPGALRWARPAGAGP